MGEEPLHRVESEDEGQNESGSDSDSSSHVSDDGEDFHSSDSSSSETESADVDEFTDEQLRSIVAFDLSGKGLSILPEDIFRLENMVELDISRNNLHYLDWDEDKITKGFKNLTLLDLSSNHLRHPCIIAMEPLSELVQLDLSGNRLGADGEPAYRLPEWSNLSRLNLSDNAIHATALEVMFALTSDEDVEEATNRTQNNASPLTEDSDENPFKTKKEPENESRASSSAKEPRLAVLESLTFLDLSSNCIAQFPESLWNLTSLVELDLAGNAISDIPPEISQLSNLKFLSLAGNRISDIAPEMGDLPNLKHLLLYSNRITKLDANLGNLKQLKTLNLGDNRLKRLPREIGNLSHLRDLDVGANQLTTLPAEVTKLGRLEDLCLMGNPLRDLTEEVQAFLTAIANGFTSLQTGTPVFGSDAMSDLR